MLPAAVLIAGWIIPQHLAMPVEGATTNNYDQRSFWAYPLRIDNSHQGWKKAFYLNPIPYLNNAV